MSRFGKITADIQITGLGVHGLTKVWPTVYMRVRVKAHTCCILTLQSTSSWHREAASPPLLLLKRFHCSLKAFYYPSNPDISDFIKQRRSAYHELFWHWDLLIFAGNISSHQSVPGVVVTRADAVVSEDEPVPPPAPPTSPADPNQPEDYNEL